MRRVAIIVLVAFVILCQVPTARANFTLVIPPGGYETITWNTEGEPGRGLYGHFEVINGSDITFFISDEAAFNDWKDGRSIQAYEVMEDVTSGDYEYLAGGGTTWYLVFDNTDEVSTTQTVEVNTQIDITAPALECSVKNNDVLSGTQEITITATDRFKVLYVEYTIAASSYPTSFNPITNSVGGNSISIKLDTKQMENGSYFISIRAYDVSYNERRMVVNFRVENEYDPSLGTLGVLTNPLVMASVLLGVVSLGVVLRRRRRFISETDVEHVPESTNGLEPTPSQESRVEEDALEEAPVIEEVDKLGIGEVPVDLRVVAFIIGALALFAPYALLIETFEWSTTIVSMTWTSIQGYNMRLFYFHNPFMLIGEFPAAVWRVVFVYQMVRYYLGRSTRRMTILAGILAEMPMLAYMYWWTLYAASIGQGPYLTIPTPLMVVAALAFLWMIPYPVPKTPFDDQAVLDKWWEQETDSEGMAPKEAVAEERSQDDTARVMEEDGVE
ncbi:MAG: hypothetical protein ACE5H4_07430 [Candidatus Thorarchaeota archaeon]